MPSIFYCFCLFSIILTYQQEGVLSFAEVSSDFLLDIDGNSIATGHKHICVLEQKNSGGIGGRANCWGYENHGRTEAPKDLDFVQIIAGKTFSCGITAEHTVHCWGYLSGQIDGLYKQITSSETSMFACGVMIDGKINCWGLSKIRDKFPKNEEKFVQVSCSGFHCCALDINAFPHCWGEQSEEPNNPLSPPTISFEDFQEMQRNEGISTKFKKSEEDIYEDFVEDEGNEENIEDNIGEIAKIQFRQLSLADGYTCGITFLGSHLRCWGSEKTLKSKGIPSYATGPYRQVSAGIRGVCAITAESTQLEEKGNDEEVTISSNKTRVGDMVECWGKMMPKVDFGVFDEVGGWDQVSVGSGQVCGVSMESELRCWGDDGIPAQYKNEHYKFIVA